MNIDTSFYLTNRFKIILSSSLIHCRLSTLFRDIFSSFYLFYYKQLIIINLPDYSKKNCKNIWKFKIKIKYL